jgi:hypothetical protein
MRVTLVSREEDGAHCGPKFRRSALQPGPSPIEGPAAIHGETQPRHSCYGSKAPAVAMILLASLFFWIHYFFSSITSHAAAVLPVVLSAGMGIPGVSVPTLTLFCIYSLGLMGVRTRPDVFRQRLYRQRRFLEIRPDLRADLFCRSSFDPAALVADDPLSPRSYFSAWAQEAALVPGQKRKREYATLYVRTSLKSRHSCLSRASPLSSRSGRRVFGLNDGKGR